MSVIDVLLKVNSEIGPGGFAALQSAGQMLFGMAQQVVSTIKALDEFSEQFNALELDISKAVGTMQGLISTQTLMTSANRLTEAEIKINSTEFEAMAKVVQSYSDSTGKDVTAAMTQLTSALITGKEKGFRPFGIEAKSAAEALEQIKLKAEEITPKIDTLSDTFESLFNNMGTSISLSWTNWINSSIESTDKSTSALSQFNQILSKENELLAGGLPIYKEYIGSFDALTAGSDEYLTRLTAMVNVSRMHTDALEAEARAISNVFSAMKGIADSGKSKQAWESSRGKPLKSGGSGGGKSKESDMVFGDEEGSEVTSVTRDWNDNSGFNWNEHGKGQSDIAAKDAAERERGEKFYQAQEAELLKKKELELIETHKKLGHETRSMARDFNSAWNGMFQNMSAGQMASAGLFDMMKNSWSNMIMAAVSGSKSVGQAIKESVMQVALGTAIEAGFMALMETARAIADYARQDYSAGSQHASAATSFAVTAAVSGAIAGGAYALPGSAVSGRGSVSTGSGAPGSDTGYSPSGSYGNFSQGNSSQKVVIVLSGGAEKLFSAVDDQNERNARSGRTSFAKR
jgi:hypothetical protein